MTARLPPLPDVAQAPGAIPAGQELLHRAARELAHNRLILGARAAGDPRSRTAHVLDVRDAIASAAAMPERDADNVVRRVLGGPANGRDPSTVQTSVVGLIVATEDKAAAAEVVAEAICGPLAAVGWTDAYEARMTAERRTFDAWPLVSTFAPGVVTHWAAPNLGLTPPQRADLEAATKPASLVIVDYPDPRDKPGKQALFRAALDELFLERHLPPDPA